MKPAPSFRPDRRRASGKLVAATLAASLPWPVLAQANGQKVLRYAFRVAETSLDPVRINDIYSRTVTPHIFEGLYCYDHLARPVRIKPLIADGEPEHSDDYRTWTVKLKRGIYFLADPAFKGQRRELVAQDYVYTMKRFADPRNKSPVWAGLENENYLGLNALRKTALETKKPFDYDREIEGVRALDRYTIQFKVEEARPRFVEGLAVSDLFGAVAREVVEFYGDQVDGHPVGTGPFRLVQWRRSSRIVLERNPEYRERFYDAEPTEGDAEGQALLQRFKGRRLPMIDRVEIAIIEEEQPRWLSFVNGEADFIERVGFEFIALAMPGGKVAPNLAKRGIRGYRQVEPGTTMLFFNMEDAIVGGYSPAQVALRRAIALAMNTPAEARLVRRGQAVIAQSPLAPFTLNHRPEFKSEMGEYDPNRAKGLLDLFGFVDRDGDGWRERPDGTPLVLEVSTQTDQAQRQLEELFKKNMDAVGIRVVFRFAQWPENLKSARAGKLMVWSVGASAAGADSQGAFARYDSRQIGGQNMARFKLPAFDKVYQRMEVIADGPERDALFVEATEMAVAYMPYKTRVNRIVTDMTYPWLTGYRRSVFWQEWWHYVDIDADAQKKALGG